MMEQDQLFKRLLSITLGDLAIFTNFDEQINDAILRLDLAARTRHIIQTVQLEDMWQALPANSNNYKIYLSMRLAPLTLCSVLDSEEEMHCLEWRLLIPKYEDITENLRPSCFGEYITMGQLEIMDIDQYDIEEACRFLDKAYDFSWLSNGTGHTLQKRS